MTRIKTIIPLLFLAAGLVLLGLAIFKWKEPFEAAFGILWIVLGVFFHFTYSIEKLEQTIKETEKKK